MQLGLTSKRVLADKRLTEAVQIIGANVQIYGHFESFQVVDKNFQSVDKITDIYEFLNTVYNFYHSKKLYNPRYGEDIDEQNAIKAFVRNSINPESYSIGLRWIDNN